MTDPKSIRLSRRGPATGTIWLSLDEFAFPAASWNDFVVVVLVAWAEALVRLHRNETQIERVHFMEGPYEIEIATAREGVLDLRALERTKASHTPRALGSAPTAFLMRDVLAAGDAVASRVRLLGDESRDTEQLEGALFALRGEGAL